MPIRTMPVAVISMVSGMTSAVISAARKLPSSRNRTTMTSSAPSARFFSTVAMVASTSLVRLSTVLTTMSGGRDRVTTCHLLRRRPPATVRLLPPISIMAVPTTDFLAVLAGASPCAARGRSRPQQHP